MAVGDIKSNTMMAIKSGLQECFHSKIVISAKAGIQNHGKGILGLHIGRQEKWSIIYRRGIELNNYQRI